MKILTIYILCLLTFSFTNANGNINTNRSNIKKIIQEVKQDSCFYWDDLKQDKKSAILKQEKISKSAIDFYQGKIVLGDNSRTINLLETLTLKNN